MRLKKDNYILKNKQGLYLSNTYRLTSSINRALVFKSSRISRINILLMTKQWVRLLCKEGLGVVCMLGFLRKRVKTSK